MLVAQRPEIVALDDDKSSKAKKTNQRFAIGPLEPGFGYTLGNSLRRILLSTLSGAAVTSVKFEGVSHEFSTIEGVREDVIDIILNLKDVVVQSHIEEEVTISVNVEGKGREGTQITAEALNTNADIEIFNPEQHIATVNSGHTFSAEFTIGVGRGYVPADRSPQASIGKISIDAIFSPIRRVSIDVEPMQVEESTEYDRLILDVNTDGVMTPRDALASAASTLRALSELIEEFGDDARGLEFAEIEEEVPQELARSILELSLTQRAENCLEREGIGTIGELLQYTPDRLLAITNFGKNSLDEVIEKLDAIGLALAERDGIIVGAEENVEGEIDITSGGDSSLNGSAGDAFGIETSEESEGDN